MTHESENQSVESKHPVLPYAEFLEGSPAYQKVTVTGLFEWDGHGYELCKPELRLLCEDKTCQGMRLFEQIFCTSRLFDSQVRNVVFVEYQCKNCERTRKSFSLIILKTSGSIHVGLVVKLGEWPPFGPETPTRLLRLLGPDQDLFLRGRRAECHGLGIGAFTYYRRVVVSQKNRLIDEIIKVVNRVEATPDDIVADLTRAKQSFQFTQAMSDVKLAVPQVLLINGHNPLTLLHSALSAGIHDKSDDECLEIAKNVRLVLAGLAERLGQALSEHKELNDAVSNLLTAKRKKAGQEGSQEENG